MIVRYGKNKSRVRGNLFSTVNSRVSKKLFVNEPGVVV
ncbi:hypothetical protein B4064_0494 [Caldibacillus thermoamylovorans]|uniref:Uncharacterized protein n=1 Tax=Caldibacillus thermoamylovorans TaxID=35841 RepID=A0A0D0EU78_9BACI|nr:hypothetical protein B4064_0494 [Caldibacillus thermoamylovorans]KIO65535.1 hypothetical protein B4065_0460 [Caldibacillus thermoamylovorans]KIO70421.1 hypothetical protein B4166_0585 [Caldibacillus thermoamylovorans]KIO72346.1 hypothetical protein B4167_0674 [Caldibacillus thermoamylovorans]